MEETKKCKHGRMRRKLRFNVMSGTNARYVSYCNKCRQEWEDGGLRWHWNKPSVT